MSGAACNNLLSYPYFIPEGTPKLGTSMKINLTSSWPANPLTGLEIGVSFLITGTSNTNWAGLTLPTQLDVPGFSPSCGTLTTSIDFIQRVDQRQTPTVAPVFFFIPNVSSLIGVSYYQQGIVFTSSSTAALIMLSRSGHGVIGT